MITKRNRPKKIWVENGTEFAGTFKKFSTDQGIQVSSTMSETRAAFAERTIGSLKNIFYRYMEDFGYKYVHKLPQFITTLNCRRNSSIDMRPNTVKFCDFMSIVYSNFYENLRNLHSKLVTECESQSMTCFLQRLQAAVYTKSFWNCSKCNKKTTNIHNQGWARRGYSRQILSKRAD